MTLLQLTKIPNLDVDSGILKSFVPPSQLMGCDHVGSLIRQKDQRGGSVRSALEYFAT
jgi:hypothetical protein